MGEANALVIVAYAVIATVATVALIGCGVIAILRVVARKQDAMCKMDVRMEREEKEKTAVAAAR